MENFKQFYKNNKITLDKILVIVVFFFGTYIFFKYIFTFVAPFIVGLIISIILDPLVCFLVRKFKMPRLLSTIISILFLIIIIGGIGALIVNATVVQGRQFSHNFSTYEEKGSLLYNKAQDFFINLFFLVPAQFRDFGAHFISSAIPFVVTYSTKLLKDFSLSFVKFFPKLFVYTIIGLISSIFMLKDKDLLLNIIRSKTPKYITVNLVKIRGGLLKALTGYFKSQLILMCFTGVICIIWLTIMGSQYSLFIGLCIALIDGLPLLGTGLVLWPWAAYSFISGDTRTGIYLVIMYSLVLLNRQIMEPRILGKQIGLHPLVTLMSVYIGLNLFGFLGLIIGPLSIVTIKSIWQNEI